MTEVHLLMDQGKLNIEQLLLISTIIIAIPIFIVNMKLSFRSRESEMGIPTKSKRKFTFGNVIKSIIYAFGSFFLAYFMSMLLLCILDSATGHSANKMTHSVQHWLADHAHSDVVFDDRSVSNRSVGQTKSQRTVTPLIVLGDDTNAVVKTDDVLYRYESEGLIKVSLPTNDVKFKEHFNVDNLLEDERVNYYIKER